MPKKELLRKYAPLNSTEGEWFTGKFCMQCIHCDSSLGGEKQCDILLAAMLYYIDDLEYPREWIFKKK